MGKIKRNKEKLHQKAVRFTDEKQEEDTLEANKSSLPAIFPITGLFINENQDVETQNQQDSKVAVRSKKDKQKERHEKFLRKLHGNRAVDESIKRAQKRSKTVIVGDMEPLLSALPTVSLSPANKRDTNQEDAGKRSKMSRKSRQKMQIAEIEHFQQVLKHPAYQSNPLGAISEHIKLAIQREADQKT